MKLAKSLVTDFMEQTTICISVYQIQCRNFMVLTSCIPIILKSKCETTHHSSSQTKASLWIFY